MKLSLTILAIVCCCISGNEDDQERTQGLPKFRLAINADIPGAPELEPAQWIQGTQQEIRTEKHGLIYPAYFDWNGDGLKDLLLGEFETGDEGSYIKVYLNNGTSTAPTFSGEYFYATDVEGNKLTNHQWCCIGIHPRVVDLDNDGFMDILSGQYNPGKISWWRGSEKGFLPRQFVDQEGYVEGARLAIEGPPWEPESNAYWNYTTTDFADLNGDGLLDLFVGGSGGLRFALNIGTAENPKFGRRKDLLHLDGNPLQIDEVPAETIKQMESQGRYANVTGVWKTYIKPVDWNRDGVLDLIVTHEYSKSTHHPIEFFEGVKTNLGLRFKTKKPLLTEAHQAKLFPGCQPMITVCDFNDDQIDDLLVGISVPTINGFEVAPEIAWEYVKNLGIQMPGKDAGRSLKYYGGLDGAVAKIESKENKFLKDYLLGKLEDPKYLTLRHRGYVFVMHGKATGSKPPVPVIQEAKPAVVRQPIKNEVTQKSTNDGPVSYSVKGPKRIKYNRTYQVDATLVFENGWFGYANSPANIEAGQNPTTVTFELPEGFEAIGEPIVPDSEIYLRGEVTFSQKFRYPVNRNMDLSKLLDQSEIKVKIKYQTCNDRTCLPPEEYDLSVKSEIKF